MVPKKVKIDHLIFDIKVDPIVKRNNLLGEVDYESQTIRLKPDQKPDALKEVLLHEILHVIFGNRGIREVSNENWNEEFLVYTLAVGLITVFKENPKISNYLLS